MSENLNPVPMDNSASRGKRLGAAIIDATVIGFLMLMFLEQTEIPKLIMEYMKLAPEQRANHEVETWWFGAKIAGLQFFVFVISQGYFLYNFGQTIGKFLLGIAIVTMENTKPGFVNLLLYRYLSQWLMGLIPMVGALLRFADILLIYRDDKRCLHDLIAKTRVIDLKIQAPVTNSIIV